MQVCAQYLEAIMLRYKKSIHMNISFISTGMKFKLRYAFEKICTTYNDQQQCSKENKTQKIE